MNNANEQGFRTHLATWLGGLCLAVALTPVAFAQEAFDEDDDEEKENISLVMIGGDKGNSLAKAQDIATGISTFVEDNLEDLFLGRYAQLSAFVPNGTFSSGLSSLHLRGLGSLSNQPGNFSAVPTYEDGTLFKSAVPLLGTGNFLSQRVVVLRGAQDALRGDNAVGGTVNRTSHRPNLKTGEPDFHARYVGGRFGRQDMGLTFGGPFSDSFGYRLTLLETTRDGVIDNAVTGVDNPGSEGSNYQEFQLQLGKGEIGRLWVRAFSLDQQNFTLPLVQLSPYLPSSDAGQFRYSKNPYSGYSTDNPALTDERSDFITDLDGRNRNAAREAGLIGNSFLSTLDPKTLHNLDNPWRVNQNFSGTESLDDTKGSILHWDLDLGSYARISLLGAYNHLEYSRTDDADRINNNTVDLRTQTDTTSSYYSREVRFGTQGKRVFSWLFGSYSYNEESSQTTSAYDAGQTIADLIDVNALGATARTGQTLPSLSAQHYTEIEVDAEDTFASLALNLGGFVLSVATRTADSEHQTRDSDLVGIVAESPAWTKYREVQWSQLRNTVGENTITAEQLQSALRTATGDNTLVYDPNTPFYGTDNIGLYIKTLHEMLNCRTTETNAPAYCASDYSSIGYNAGTRVTGNNIDAALKLQEYIDTLAAAGNEFALNRDMFGSNPTYVQFQPGYLGPTSENLWGCTINNRSGRCTKNSYSGDSTRATVEISLGEGHMLYFASLEGYRAGGYLSSSDNGLASPSYKPETVEGTEYGLKLGWSKFKLNIAAFDYTYTDMQAVAEHLRSDGILFQSPFNVDTATATGLEVDFSWKLAGWLQFNLSYGSLETEVTQGSWTEPSLLGGNTINLVKNTLPYAPETQWAANMQIHLSETLFWTVSRRLQSDTYFTVFNSPYAFMPEHEIVDARLVFRTRDDRMRITLYGENLEDTVSWSHAVEGRAYLPTLSANGAVTTQRLDVNGGSSSTFTATTLNPPRTVGLQVDFRF